MLAKRELKDQFRTSKELGYVVRCYCKKDMHNGEVQLEVKKP